MIKYIAIKNDDETYSVKLIGTFHFNKTKYSDFTDEQFYKFLKSRTWNDGNYCSFGWVFWNDYSITETATASEKTFKNSLGENHTYYIPAGIPHGDYYIEDTYYFVD